jgi:hypothetical protein
LNSLGLGIRDPAADGRTQADFFIDIIYRTLHNVQTATLTGSSAAKSNITDAAKLSSLQITADAWVAGVQAAEFKTLSPAHRGFAGGSIIQCGLRRDSLACGVTSYAQRHVGTAARQSPNGGAGARAVVG